MKTLLVDDNKVNVKLLKTFLSPYGHCDTADRGKEALHCFNNAYSEEDPYDLICLDIMMPEIDGHTVLSEIREIEDEKGIPTYNKTIIIMVSAADEKGNVIKAFKGQCDAYLKKPVKKNDLLKHLYLLKLVDADTLARKILKIE